MEIKQIEIRDKGTLIPALAIRFNGGFANRLMWRAGFGPDEYVVLIHMASMRCSYDPYGWGDYARTMQVAHDWLINNWQEQQNNGVLDVQYILNETDEPKTSEIFV